MGKQHTGSLPSLHKIKTKLQKFALLAMVMLAFGVMLLGKADTYLVEKGRILLDDIATPVLALLSKTAESI